MLGGAADMGSFADLIGTQMLVTTPMELWTFASQAQGEGDLHSYNLPQQGASLKSLLHWCSDLVVRSAPFSWLS